MVIIDEKKCINCGACVKDCVAKAIKIENGKARTKNECIQCGHCVAVCPVNAVSIPEYDMNDIEIINKKNIVDPDNLLYTIKSRRSIRNFQSKNVEKDKIRLMIDAGRYTPTAKNNQNCQFIIVQENIDELKKIVWDYIEDIPNQQNHDTKKLMLPYILFNRRRKNNSVDDFLFRNAPVVIFITSDFLIDTGLVEQSIELMAVSQHLGVLHNGYLANIANMNQNLKNWLGINEKTITGCILLGYPAVNYKRTVPRKKAGVIWK